MEKEETLPVWHQTIDFDALMREARKHIAALSGKLWTDHNSSDPGITQLEVLAFCIADLSYRTSFGIDDILAGYKGGKSLDLDLPLANSALPNAPVTVKDLRKVLLDMSHPLDSKKLLIRNAFPIIAEGTEIPFFAVSEDKQETSLSYTNSYWTEGGPKGAPEMVLKEYTNIDEIVLNGLYAIQLEFEEEENETELFLKDLNQNYFEQDLVVGNNVYTISVLFPYWDDINWALRTTDLSQATLTYRKRDNSNQDDYFFAVDKLNYDDYFYDYYAELELNGHLLTAYIKLKSETPIQSFISIAGQTYSFKANFIDWNELSNGVNRVYALSSTGLISGPTLAIEGIRNVSIDGIDQLFDIQAKFEIYKNGAPKDITLLTRITFDPDVILPDNLSVSNALLAAFQGIYNEQIALEEVIYSIMKTATASMYDKYLKKLKKVFFYLYEDNGVWSYIGKYRNLCEDYSKFTASRVQEIALFGNLLVSPDFNSNELLAEVYFRIDQFLHPLVKFHTLDEITDKGLSFEQVFNGPLLKHGFIEDKDLENLKRRSVVYTSDLVRIIMDVPGVEAVENFSISSYIDNRLMGRNVINCLNLTEPDVYKPRLTLEKSGLQVLVDRQKEKLDLNVLKARYLDKLALIKQQQQIQGASFDLHIPLGDDMEIEEYKSVQHDYPEVYGIGEFGLPAEATDERKAQAKQLKAYLLMFEQLLANYLQQVAHLPELFSFNRSIDHTYAYQPLYEVPDVAPLFQGFVQGNDSWEVFKQDLDNSYQTAMRQGESVEQWRSRRNRFLSHLIARFGESFEAYATQQFNRYKDILNDPMMIGLYQQRRGEVLDGLIDTKIAFAEDLERVTGGRYQSFDTTWLPTMSQMGGWNNDNIGSYKLRLCRLLGIENTNNLFLFGTGVNGEDLEGMHILEHILIRPRTSSNLLLGLHNRSNSHGSFVYEADKDPYSFRVTVVLPINSGRFKNEAFRNFTERLIRLETPAHILIDFRWMNASCGKNFEKYYSLWKDHVYRVKPYLFQNSTGPISKDGGPILAPDPLPDKASLLQIPAEIVPNNGLAPVATVDPILDKGGPVPNKVNALAAIVDPLPAKGNVIPRVVDPLLVTAEAVPDRVDLLEAKQTRRELVDDKDVLALQDLLIQALNTPCRLEVKLYNEIGIIFNESRGKITFENTKTDVFFVRVSELYGDLIVSKWSVEKGQWLQKKEFKAIDQYYVSVADLLGEQQGLTTKYGGVGSYLLSYQIDDRIEDIFIDVTKEIIPVHIYIGLGDQMLNFNTETDGVFRISTKELKGYFLQMLPKGGGSALISSSKGLPPTAIALTKTENKVSFSTIYSQFGAGMFEISYELDGQSTFASIDIYLEVSLAVLDGKQELPVNAENTVVIPSVIRKINVIFDPKGGMLKVFDRAAAIPNSLPVDPENPAAGTVLFLRAADTLRIDRDKVGIWIDGKTYDFVYTFNGIQERRALYFEPGTVQLDATFTLSDVVKTDARVFTAKGQPVSTNAESYSWRIEGVFVSRAKNPTLNLDFRKNDVLDIQLTVFLNGSQASYSLKVFHDVLAK